MDIALLFVVNCKFDIIFNRTQCNYMTYSYCNRHSMAKGLVPTCF